MAASLMILFVGSINSFWTTLSTVFSILSLVGANLSDFLMSIILKVSGDVTSAIIAMVGFYGFAKWIVTLLRLMLVSNGGYLHPILLILSVLGGLNLVGFLGVVSGSQVPSVTVWEIGKTASSSPFFWVAALYLFSCYTSGAPRPVRCSVPLPRLIS